MTVNRATNSRAAASKLASAMLDVVDRFAPNHTWADYATVLGDYSILTDRFAKPYRVGTYVVLAPFFMTHDWMDTGPDGNNHQHLIRRPQHFDRLRPGDRVLIIWLTDQTEPCVVGKVMRSEVELFSGNGNEP